RHTRSYGDWSSDVCSSDLPSPASHRPFTGPSRASHRPLPNSRGTGMRIGVPKETVADERRVALTPDVAGRLGKAGFAVLVERAEIGRASCRERGEVGGGGG